MNKKSNVTWVKPTEPSFLKKFKNDVGYKEGPTIDAKRQMEPVLDDDSGSDREDELPQVVVLKSGDLSADEVKMIKNGPESALKEESAADGKILFKKPTKSSSEKFKGITASSNKKRKNEGDGENKTFGKKVKNNSLLSFGGDDDDEED